MDLKIKLLEAAHSWPTFSPIGAGHGRFQESEYPVDRTDLSEEDGTTEDESDFSKSDGSKSDESPLQDGPGGQDLERGDVTPTKNHNAYWKPSKKSP